MPPATAPDLAPWLTAARTLPQDGLAGTLIGRVWVPGAPAGPSVVVLRPDGVHDLTRLAPTVSELLDGPDPAGRVRDAKDLPRIGDIEAILANSTPEARDPARPYFLTPCDLQALKASGVTFIASLIERVIEEQARGDPGKAETVRRQLGETIGGDLSAVKPGSAEAAKLKEVLLARGAWSQYLEVGIGPDAEIFTKSQPMSAVGTGAEIGIHPRSTWNNPEPEIVLAVNGGGTVVGVSLGNDVNLRDFEGRSALLLGRAKDNNASCAIGPFIRLLDETFTLDDARATDVTLEIEGPEGFKLSGVNSIGRISRDLLELVRHTIGPHHQYPDGFMLFSGTMFAPTEDRDAPGKGFTHKPGDIVRVSSSRLGALVNRVTTSDKAPPWRFGTGALMRNLAARGMLAR